MAYLILGIGALYSFYWLLTFLFSLRSKGDRSLVIPMLFILVFAGVGAFGFQKLSEAKENPDKLTEGLYQKLSLGMSPEEVKSSLEPLEPLNMSKIPKGLRLKYELSSNQIKMPPEVMTRLGSSQYIAPRTDAYMSFAVVGEESKVIAKPKAEEKDKDKKDEPDTYESFLGHPATKSMNGVVGLRVRFFEVDADATLEVKKEQAEKSKALKEENKTRKEIADEMEHLIIPALKDKKVVVVEEGVDWTFTAEMTTGMIAKTICEKAESKSGGDFVCEYTYQEEYDKCKSACEAKEPWVSYYNSLATETCAEDKKAASDCVLNTCVEECALLEVESFDNRFNVKVNPESKTYMGVLGNAWSTQVDSGANKSFLVRQTSGGMNVKFRGGADAARIRYWEENDIILDDDFLTNSRLLVAGFINGKLVAVGQKGIELPPGAESKLAYTGQ
jgi:hypothetical protein